MTTSGPVVGRIDRIHWDTDSVRISLIDVDTGERRSAQFQHVVGRLQNYDPAQMATRESKLTPQAPEDPPGIGVVDAG